MCIRAFLNADGGLAALPEYFFWRGVIRITTKFTACVIRYNVYSQGVNSSSSSDSEMIIMLRSVSTNNKTLGYVKLFCLFGRHSHARFIVILIIINMLMPALLFYTYCYICIQVRTTLGICEIRGSFNICLSNDNIHNYGY